uniref:Uncharacterized protein n=1 Tax=viral metagenome TaxID=1070528 RepID=A0A6C0E9M9_9ZZZZ
MHVRQFFRRFINQLRTPQRISQLIAPVESMQNNELQYLSTIYPNGIPYSIILIALHNDGQINRFRQET